MGVWLFAMAEMPRDLENGALFPLGSDPSPKWQSCWLVIFLFPVVDKGEK